MKFRFENHEWEVCTFHAKIYALLWEGANLCHREKFESYEKALEYILSYEALDVCEE